MSHRLSRIFARFVGLSFTILGIWIFAVSIVNINDMSDSGGVLVWVITASALGAIGGILFLLSSTDQLDSKPARFDGMAGSGWWFSASSLGASGS